jgi:hypothetical protein
VLLLVGIVVAAVVLWPDDQSAKPKKLPARIVSVPPLGLGFVHPTSWKRKVSKAVIGLRSPEGSIVIFLSSPAARPARDEVRAGAKAQLLKQFKPATIVNEGSDRLGVRNVPSFELRGKDNGKAIRALELVDETKYRTYAVTVVTSANPSRARLKEARAIISTLRFTKPKTAPAPAPAKPK